MKILIICDRLDTPYGGLERHVIDQANGLSKNNEVLLCSNAIGGSVQNLLNSNIKKHFPWNQRNWELTKYDLDFKPDIVHCHPFSAYNIGYSISKFFNSKLFATHHGLYVTGFGNDNFGQNFSNKISKVYAVDYIVKNILLNTICSKNKIKILYNSIDINKFTSPKPLNLPINLKRKNIVIISRLEDNKEIPIRQILKISDKLNYNIIIVGGGLAESEFREISTNKENVYIMGSVDNTQDYMSIADLCLCSARTAIEAIVSGKNVIQSGIGKFGDFVTLKNYKDTVFNYNRYRDYTNKELIDLIEFAIKQPINKDLQNIIKEKCNVENFINTLENDYKEILYG